MCKCVCLRACVCVVLYKMMYGISRIGEKCRLISLKKKIDCEHVRACVCMCVHVCLCVNVCVCVCV